MNRENILITLLFEEIFIIHFNLKKKKKCRQINRKCTRDEWLNESTKQEVRIDVINQAF